MTFINLFSRAWSSPTITTWATFLSRPLNLLLLTPLIVTRFTIEEAAVWFLFTIFLGLQSLADFGLNSSLTRAYAYAYGGSKDIKIFENIEQVDSSNGINWNLAEKINSSLTLILLLLSIIFIIILSIFGTLTLITPIGKIDKSDEAWVAWCIIILSTGINIYGYKYTVFLKGMNNIALFMRWQTLFSILSIIFSSLVIFLTSSLLYFILTYQIWLVLSVIRNKYLAHSLFQGQFKNFKVLNIDRNVLKNIIPSAWRTWLAQFMSYGLIQISGLFYAQISDPSSTAMYLFSLKIINFIKQFSNAPFYSRLPRLAKLFVEKKMNILLNDAKKGMLLSHITFVLTFIIAGICINPILNQIGSKVEFANPILWSFMGLSFWLERYGAMHFQLHGITNKVVAHIGNGISGFIYLILVFTFIQKLDVYTFPLSYAAACLLFYSWYGAYNSKSFFKFKFVDFEIKTSFFPLLTILLYILIIIYLS